MRGGDHVLPARRDIRPRHAEAAIEEFNISNPRLQQMRRDALGLFNHQRSRAAGGDAAHLG